MCRIFDKFSLVPNVNSPDNFTFIIFSIIMCMYSNVLQKFYAGENSRYTVWSIKRTFTVMFWNGDSWYRRHFGTGTEMSEKPRHQVVGLKSLGSEVSWFRDILIPFCFSSTCFWNRLIKFHETVELALCFGIGNRRWVLGFIWIALPGNCLEKTTRKINPTVRGI